MFGFQRVVKDAELGETVACASYTYVTPAWTAGKICFAVLCHVISTSKPFQILWGAIALAFTSSKGLQSIISVLLHDLSLMNPCFMTYTKVSPHSSIQPLSSLRSTVNRSKSEMFKIRWCALGAFEAYLLFECGSCWVELPVWNEHNSVGIPKLCRSHVIQQVQVASLLEAPWAIAKNIGRFRILDDFDLFWTYCLDPVPMAVVVFFTSKRYNCVACMRSASRRGSRYSRCICVRIWLRVAWKLPKSCKGSIWVWKPQPFNKLRSFESDHLSPWFHGEKCSHQSADLVGIYDPSPQLAPLQSGMPLSPSVSMLFGHWAVPWIRTLQPEMGWKI